MICNVVILFDNINKFRQCLKKLTFLSLNIMKQRQYNNIATIHARKEKWSISLYLFTDFSINLFPLVEIEAEVVCVMGAVPPKA